MGKFTKFDMRMFEEAHKVARESDFKNFHIGCVITYKKHIVSSGCNSNKTSPLQKKYNRKYRKFNIGNKPIEDKVHGEIRALSDIPYPIAQNMNFKDAAIYIYRISKGKPFGFGLARPCPACRAAIKDAGIKKIYYTTDDGFAMEELY